MEEIGRGGVVCGSKKNNGTGNEHGESNGEFEEQRGAEEDGGGVEEEDGGGGGGGQEHATTRS